jgi:uncharacterized transporter YbjL
MSAQSGLAALVVIAIGILVSKKFSAKLSKKGLNVSFLHQFNVTGVFQASPYPSGHD